MKIRLRNEIQLDQEMEVICQEFDVRVQEKNGQLYLMFQNEEGEKVIIKCDEAELTMTRFSNPKTVMRFVKHQEAILVLPTPMGLQHFVTVTKAYQLNRAQGVLQFVYDLKPLESDQLFASYEMRIEWG
ncbi:DUF1934 domain-containing protein [Streptococcus ovuberis]|uniref:DUF1934 domain-containing protein n=1 Tax=Streptococcus ovuberis TaxID=1936207 RepID=A0A7X6S2I2_9STRE|nr:DUF1934 domain-containing protein [Streptococcus ovuberis]NKZ21271.1 DUF1934 domain-containing protein [Streptococcus ovuberis]